MYQRVVRLQLPANRFDFFGSFFGQAKNEQHII
jgi:hypothetical protein